MNNERITFETAKLAKQKHCNITDSMGMGIGLYDNEGKPWSTCFYGEDEQKLAPYLTQALLQRWLREKHLIFITIDIVPYSQPNAVVSYTIKIKSLSSKNQGENLATGFLETNSYEKSLEVALVIGLNLINDEQ